MAAKDFDPEIEAMAADFGSAATLMLRVLVSYLLGQMSLGDALNGVADITEALAASSQAYADEVVPNIYADGAGEVIASPETPDVGPEALTLDLHDQSLGLLQEDLSGRLLVATANMGEDAKRTVREIARGQIAANLATDANPRVDAPGMQRQIEDKGVKIVDDAGRRLDSQAYAEMVLRDAATDTANEAHLNTAGEIGSPGVRVSDGSGRQKTDEACEEANGQNWSLAYARLHKREHPNCRRTFSPLPSDFDGELDRV